MRKRKKSLITHVCLSILLESKEWARGRVSIKGRFPFGSGQIIIPESDICLFVVNRNRIGLDNQANIVFEPVIGSSVYAVDKTGCAFWLGYSCDKVMDFGDACRSIDKIPRLFDSNILAKFLEDSENFSPEMDPDDFIASVKAGYRVDKTPNLLPKINFQFCKESS